MRYDEIDRRNSSARQPGVNYSFHGPADGERSRRTRARAAVEQECPILPEQKIDERPFAVQTLVLAQDERVLVEVMNLERRVRVGGTVGRAVNPLNVQRSRHV